MADYPELNESAIYIVDTPRRRGRPVAIDPTTNVQTRLPNSCYDQLAKLAHRHGLSMSAVVRQIVVLRLKDLP
jgi:hypothetical protein